jgi:topoisomerase-4 subunit A
MRDDLKHLMQEHYLKYASYVILDRAIPNVVDGLKPVQRRILETLRKMHDGKLHKVSNVVGQSMQLHPHGDAPIKEALVNIANKGFLLDTQGNFGNIYTGDPSAAARYIETRLSDLAHETMFNPDLTAVIPSYDGRNKEPVCLPAKIPLLLMQGADGIAVGMSTHILPHNFCELIEAEIAILEGNNFKILPDFITGGIMDASQYDKGKGKIKLRAKLEVRDPKTLVITQICYGTTTESLIRSIDEAAKKNKIKIEAINDYTASKVEIEIKLPRGQYAQDVIDSLYAYTECEVTLNSQIVVIKDDLPAEMTVDEVIHHNVTSLQYYLKTELEIDRDRLTEKILEKTLEQIFIENRLYKKIEEISSYDKIHTTIETSLVPFHKKLSRVPTYEDRERLLSRYLRDLLKKYGKEFPRRTQIKAIEEIDRRAIETRTVKVGYDHVGGFVGTKVSGDHSFECTNFDKLLIMYSDGVYQVINIPEKQYIQREGTKIAFVGVADKKTVFSVAYRDPKSKYCYAKRFIVSKFILDKVYNYFEKGMELQYITTAPQVTLEMHFNPKPKQKLTGGTFKLDSVLVKNVSAKGVRMANREVKKVFLEGTVKPQPDLFSKK